VWKLTCAGNSLPGPMLQRAFPNMQHKLTIPEGIVICSNGPEKLYGHDALVFTGRVQFMGGEYRAANPNKFNGAAKDIEILVDIRDTAKSYGANAAGRQAGALITKEISFVSIIGAKLAK
jgi:hypothetical protein